MSNLSAWMIAGIVVLFGAFLCASLGAEIFGFVGSGIQDWLRRRFGFPRDVQTGAEGLAGAEGVVRTGFRVEGGGELEGMIFVRGELWRAISQQNQESDITPGMQVRVVRVRGLTLEVEPLEQLPLGEQAN